MFASMPRPDRRNEVYEEERKEADNLPHRSRDLEMAIFNLQMGPLKPQVQEILDRHREAIPGCVVEEHLVRADEPAFGGKKRKPAIVRAGVIPHFNQAVVEG